MTVDLTDVSPQVAGYFNSGATAGRSAAQVAFKCLTSPLVLPINDGSFAPLEVVLPPGRVVGGVKPAGGAQVDDDPDDGRRHDHPGAGAGDARPGRRRPPRRPAGRPTSSAPTRARAASSSLAAACRRRLGRQARRRRHERRDLHQRRRHPQRPVGGGRGQVPAPRRGVRAAAGLRRRRALPRRAGRASRWCAHATTSASTPDRTGWIAGRGGLQGGLSGHGN